MKTLKANHNRILLLTPFQKSQRGNSLTAERLQKGLASRGWDLEVLSLEESYWPDLLRRRLKDNCYQLVHGLNAYYSGQVLEKVPEIKRLPLILTTTGTDINCDLQGDTRELVLAALRNAVRIIVFNDERGKMLAASQTELRSKIVTIPQGIYLPGSPTRTRRELGMNENEVVFLLPSGLRPIKNIDLAIDALEKLHYEYPLLRLVIMGAMIDHLYSQHIFNRINALNWISYPGEIPHNMIRSIMRLGDVVLNTSHAEGQPQSVLEAMSLGLPGILTAVPGNLNIITPGVEGFYIHNESELIQAAQLLLTDFSLRQAMGSAAREMVMSKFSLDREIDAYERIYKELEIKCHGCQ